jgi:hypothetical protein
MHYVELFRHRNEITDDGLDGQNGPDPARATNESEES